MDVIPTLPIFYKLRGRRVVVAGGDAPVVWKVELLMAAGATVDIYASTPSADLVQLVGQQAADVARIVERSWRESDIAGAALAIGSFEDEEGAGQFRDAARRAGVPVNVIDKPAYCDFQFGTIVARSPLVIGLSTDGAAPVLGQALRARIEALLPNRLQEWAQAAKDWRPLVQAREFDFRGRRRFWEQFAALALDSVDSVPTAGDRDRCFAAVERSDAVAARSVTLVGCGSGKADALTMQGIRQLQNADLVLYDEDVPPSVANFARRESQKFCLTDTHLRTDAADEILASTDGKVVVWLGTGDPTTCRRWQARLEHLVAMRTAVDWFPGLLGCPACGSECLWQSPAAPKE